MAAAFTAAALLAMILPLTSAALDAVEPELMQIIKDLQAEGLDLRQRLGTLEKSIQAQDKYIWEQDKRIRTLENIVKSKDETVPKQSGGKVFLNDAKSKLSTKDIVKGNETKYGTLKVSQIYSNSSESNREDKRVKRVVKTRAIPAKSDIKGQRREVEVEEKKTENNEHVQRPVRFLPSAVSPVAFQAWLGHDLSHIAKHQTIVFDSVYMNIGGGYHSHHGLFTAPKSGIYIFSASVLMQPHCHIEALMMKNGKDVIGIFGNALETRSFSQGSGTAVMELNTGDEVWIETSDWSPDTALRGGTFTNFMGCLVTEF